MRYLSIEEVLELHRLLRLQTGGAAGIRDFGLLESALAQPMMSFSNQDLYPSLEQKAAALCFSLVCNHPFVDGNKRVAHAAMEVFLYLNGSQLIADTDDAEQTILDLATGKMPREQLLAWVEARIRTSGP